MFTYTRVDGNWVKVSQFSDTDPYINWDDILNKPNVSIQDIEDAIGKQHTHQNPGSLSKITQDQLGSPLWDNKPWPVVKTSGCEVDRFQYTKSSFFNIEDVAFDLVEYLKDVGGNKKLVDCTTTIHSNVDDTTCVFKDRSGVVIDTQILSNEESMSFKQTEDMILYMSSSDASITATMQCVYFNSGSAGLFKKTYVINHVDNIPNPVFDYLDWKTRYIDVDKYYIKASICVHNTHDEPNKNVVVVRLKDNNDVLLYEAGVNSNVPVCIEPTYDDFKLDVTGPYNVKLELTYFM